MRERPEEYENSIKPVIIHHNLILHFETTPPKSRWIFAGSSSFLYLIFTAFFKSLLFK